MTARRFPRRRGRPRTIKPAHDNGTPELQRKRKQQATAEAIDACLSAGLINEAQHQAALLFRRLYRARFGNPHIRALDLTRPSHYSLAHTQEETGWQQAQHQGYRRIAQQLETNGTLVAVLRVAVFDDASITQQHRPSAQHTLARLRLGLDTVHNCAKKAK